MAAVTSSPGIPTHRFARLRGWGLPVYRLAMLTLIVLLLREQHQKIRRLRERPIELDEVRVFLPQAAALDRDTGPRQGLTVLDETARQIGYACRTSPFADHETGYAGPTDTLIVFDTDERVVGIAVRHSEDTVDHVADVVANEYFMTRFNGMDWEQLGAIDTEFDFDNPDKPLIEGVSGASMTSLCMARSMQYRVRDVPRNAPPPPRFTVAARDIGLLLVVGCACAFAFTKLRSRKRLRKIYHVALIAYLGFYLGDLLALPLLIGWSESGVPWQTAPGLVLLAVAAFAVPLLARRPIYCGQICPHGRAQEMLIQLKAPRLKIPRSVDRGLRWAPLLLLGFAAIIAMYELPFDLAGIEPFDAYLWRTAGWATLGVAVVGLVFSIFVPMGYCKYGCPTGAVLELIRSHGRADHFNRRDLAALLLAALAAALYRGYDAYALWLAGG
jgi:NosR/NirI family nitrous oxide reductase transcriptional regulator